MIPVEPVQGLVEVRQCPAQFAEFPIPDSRGPHQPEVAELNYRVDVSVSEHAEHSQQVPQVSVNVTYETYSLGTDKPGF